MASWASAWSGLFLVRGREPLPGRTRTSDSSYSRGLNRRASMSAHMLREVGQRLGGGADVLDLDTVDPQPDDGTGGRHPVIGVGPPQPAVQRPRGDQQAVGRLDALPAETVDLGGQVRPAGRFRGRADARRRAAATPNPSAQGRPARPPQVSARPPRAGRRRCRVGLGALHLEVGITVADNRTHILQRCSGWRRRVARWPAAIRRCVRLRR